MCKFYNIPLSNMYLFDLTPHFKYAEMDLMSDLVNLSIHLLNNIAEDRVLKSEMFFYAECQS